MKYERIHYNTCTFERTRAYIHMCGAHDSIVELFPHVWYQWYGCCHVFDCISFVRWALSIVVIYLIDKDWMRISQRVAFAIEWRCSFSSYRLIKSFVVVRFSPSEWWTFGGWMKEKFFHYFCPLGIEYSIHCQLTKNLTFSLP